MRVIPISRAAGKALAWVSVTSGLGLIQLFVVLFLSRLMPSAHFFRESLLRSGVLLFFVMALVATITVDYYFDKRIALPHLLEGMLFAYYPIVVTLFVVASYAAFLLGGDRIDVQVAGVSQRLAILSAICYATTCKFLMYLHDETGRKK